MWTGRELTLDSGLGVWASKADMKLTGEDRERCEKPRASRKHWSPLQCGPFNLSYFFLSLQQNTGQGEI